MPTTITLPAEFLFEFTSFQQWVNKAASCFKSVDTKREKVICIDTNGNVMTIGEDFMIASDMELFHCKVYRLIRTVEHFKS